MDKNTVWAIVLSTIVIGAFIFLQSTVFAPKPSQEIVSENINEQQIDTAISETVQSTEPSLFTSTATEETIEEQTITITTDRVKAVFTNKGGDIISYELLQHIDTDTNKGVEMVDNVSENNRSCAISFGGENSPIINDLFNVEQIDDNTILFTKQYDKFSLGKKYTFMPGEYMFKLEILLHSNDGNISLNNNNIAYTIRTSPQVGPHYNPRVNKYDMRSFLVFDGNKKKTIQVGSNQFKSYNKKYTWAGIAGKYFEGIFLPADSSIMTEEPYYSSRIEVNDYANAQALLTRKSFTGVDMADTYYIYFGPRNEAELSIYNVKDKNGWQLENTKLTESLQGYGWLAWLEKILKWVLEMLYKVVRNWGVAIIVMTILLKIAMFPLTKKQSVGTLKMQAIQPKMQEIQTKYKDNPQKMQTEMAKLYKENNYNPTSGCLPMIFQFLLIFAMYDLFNNYFEFRGASFIPGWIPDLSTGDSVYTFQKDIPIISSFLGNSIRLLPIIYLFSQLFYGKITMVGGAAAGKAGQMKFMMYGMPLLFFFLFYNAPSGLLLYWTVSNLIQMFQQVMINKFMAKKKAEINSDSGQFKIVPKNKKR